MIQNQNGPFISVDCVFKWYKNGTLLYTHKCSQSEQCNLKPVAEHAHSVVSQTQSNVPSNVVQKTNVLNIHGLWFLKLFANCYGD